MKNGPHVTTLKNRSCHVTDRKMSVHVVSVVARPRRRADATRVGASASLRFSLLALMFTDATALKEHDFRKCADTPFCKLHRNQPPFTWAVNASSVTFSDNALRAQLLPSGTDEPLLPLLATLTVLVSGAVRVHISDDPNLPSSDLEMNDPAVSKPEGWDDEMDGDWDAPQLKLGRAVKSRFEPTLALTSPEATSPASQCSRRVAAPGDDRLRCVSDTGQVVEVRLLHAPVSISVLDGAGEAVAVLNGRGKLRFEPFRQAVESDAAEAPSKTPPHTFNGHTDPMTYGSSSVGFDIDFPSATHSYGLPERTVAHALPPTLGAAEPYRLFNLDVFEYELDHPMGVYGSIPFLHAHAGATASFGVLWLNPSETFVDLGCEGGGNGVCSHWFSASGTIDAYIFTGDTPHDVTRQHAALTGVTPLPPLFALGYHQCRWNYRDEDDVDRVHAAFEEHSLPVDVIWLDIEHTDGKRYFSWDPSKFGTPEAMQARLARTGRKMVTIVDPHLKADDDYLVFADARDKQLLVLKEDNSSHFEGDCWPGRSAWVDYLLPEARAFWASRFSAASYLGSTESLYTWNDMNEPSVFDGPEITMPPSLLHRDATGQVYEHRELHNMYGMLMHAATHEGQRQAYPDRRPFVLTRAFFAGSQRYAAVWTGDNKASWAHLAASTPMLLSLSVAGMPFVGADVGGFFGNPSTQLLVRWYQAAVFHPFLRAHAEFKTKRREPFLFGDEVTTQVRHALRLRYSLLPYLYTLFAAHRAEGRLVMRPMWHEFPADDQVRGAAWWMPEPPPTADEPEASPASEGAAGEEPAADAPADGGEDAQRALSEDAPAEACSCFKCDDTPCHPPECGTCGSKEASGCRMVSGVAYPQWGCYTTDAADCTCEKAPNYDEGGYGEEDYMNQERMHDRLDDDDDDDYHRRMYGRYGEDGYNEDDEYGGHRKYGDEADEEDLDNRYDRDDDDHYTPPATDYNAEYYHGDAGAGSDSDGQDEGQRQTGEQFMLGPHLLVQPVTQIDLQNTSVYLPASGVHGGRSVWYDLHTAAAHTSDKGGVAIDFDVHADRVPAFVRGGAVLPTRERLRRSSQATHADPFTLIVAPDAEGARAAGEIFLDSYDGFDDGTNLTAKWSFVSGVLTSRVVAGAHRPPAATSLIERVCFWGQEHHREVIVRTADGSPRPGAQPQAIFDATAGTLTVRQPKVRVGEAWSIAFAGAFHLD